jgi:hypothetical protein
MWLTSASLARLEVSHAMSLERTWRHEQEQGHSIMMTDKHDDEQ